jgi:U3 small nucleolar RNA-associated protein 18
MNDTDFLSLFLNQIDGKDNEKVQSIYFADLPLTCAEFTPNGKEIIASGTKKHFYVYDLDSGEIDRVESIIGNFNKYGFKSNTILYLYVSLILNLILGVSNGFLILDYINACLFSGRTESKLKKFLISPDNNFLVFLGNDGYIVIVSNKSKQWIGNLKMNGQVTAAAFSPDGRFLYTAGGD